MKALYRKYRPISLDTIVGQDQVVEPLKNALSHDKISHAYLFCGPRGTGKTSIARIFAHAINGFKYELEDNYIDIIEIDAASNTGVDNIRDLREKAIIAPTEGKYKIYIIDEVHMLSKSAFNALLKLMEEPPAHVVFIMATTNPEKVPITITSRAQLFTFRLADSDTMQAHLAKIAKEEKIKISPEALEIIVKRGGGSFRDSISLLDQISSLSSGEEITAEAVNNALGLPADVKIDQLLELYAQGNINEATDIIRDFLNNGTEAEPLAASLVEHIVNHPSPETLTLATKLFDVQDPFAGPKLLVAFLSANAAPVVAAPVTRPAASPKLTPRSASKTAPVSSQPVTNTTPQAAPEKTNSQSTFVVVGSSDDFMDAVAERASGIVTLLEKATINITDDAIDIYPAIPFHKKVFTAENNLDILKEVSGSRRLNIHEANEKPSGNPSGNSSTSNISAIMGAVQEVNENADDPF